MSETNQEVKKAKYTVTSKFAGYKVGRILELTVPCPAAARPHVKLLVDAEEQGVGRKEKEGLDALKRIFEKVAGKSAGNTGVEKIEAVIVEALNKSSAAPEPEQQVLPKEKK